jgi:hypothetical protein
MNTKLNLVLALMGLLSLQAPGATSENMEAAVKLQGALTNRFDEKSVKHWTRVEPLGEAPRRVTEDLPLSDQPLYLIFDSETMPEWFGMPNDADLPSTFSIEYVRAWKHQG